jgi:geranylgeranyl diphosphate synthase type I
MTARRNVDRSLARRVTDELLAYIDRERTMLEPEAQPLLDELESLVTSGGKRLRPRFCYWGHRAAGGADGEQIVRVGAALELLHTMALIHDDVMDRSDVRRNRASTFRALAELSAGVAHRGDPNRFGASAAILTGLLGFALADRLFRTSGFVGERLDAAATRYDRLRTTAIAGQYLDLLAAYRGEADEPTARRIAVLKSGSYSVADPLVIGALLATDDGDVIEPLEAYGVALGEAFQMRDDILGTFGDEAETGKDRDGDVREGKQTVLLAKARAAADDAQRLVLDTWVGNADVSPGDVDLVRRVMVDTGALGETEKLLESLAHQARDAIETAALDGVAVAALGDLALAATARRS